MEALRSNQAKNNVVLRNFLCYGGGTTVVTGCYK